MTDELTVQVSLIRKLGESMTAAVEHHVEHTYKSEKAAREDFALLSKMLEKFKEIPE